MTDLVSVIIPVYNREAHLRDTLDSIKVQIYYNWECLLVDDHSTDESLNILKQFEDEDPRFKVLIRPDNRPKGANACRNFGFEHARGKYVNWFDSDDLMKPTFLQSKVEKHLEGHYDFVLSKTIISKLGSNNYQNELRTRLTLNLLEDFLTRNITWYLPDPMFKNSFLKDKKLFDEYLLGGQDRDFFRRILLADPKIAIVEDYSRIYLLHGDSISESIYRKQTPEVLVSIFKAQAKYIDILKERKLLSKKLKQFYFKELIKFTPFLYKSPVLLIRLENSLLQLQMIDFYILKLWFKYYMGLTSLKIIGKGQKLFK